MREAEVLKRIMRKGKGDTTKEGIGLLKQSVKGGDSITLQT